MRPLFFNSLLLIVGIILVILVIFVSGSAETYGAESNPTGNPIGGGAGYSGIITATDAGVKYVVSTKEELLIALKDAKAGETVFVSGTSVIDMTGTPSVTIPAGVTLAGDRGFSGSSGALIKRTQNLAGTWEEAMFIAGGDDVRITGLQLEGEMKPQDDESVEDQYYLVGIYAENRTGFEVDNCEIRGWSWSGVSLREDKNAHIHHNYIHHNQARGEGYGTNLYGGTALIEANLYEYNRHDITGAGMPGEGYEARYNLILGKGDATGASHFDVHKDEEAGSGLAGNLYKIHHNTFEPSRPMAVGIRAVPRTGVSVDHNIFKGSITDSEGGVPIYQSGGKGKMYVTDNYWKGDLISGDTIVWYISES